ncbi:uncharacterized protein TNCV_3084761 [Trichonephila clavipes]|nr:uncharacterized protein TNCV_3084761 [Trichonephila clavipes]
MLPRWLDDTGVHQRMKDIIPNAEFVYFLLKPHSLKIVCVHAPSVETVLEAKREEFVDDALIYAKSLCEELGISFGRRKHIFGDGSKDVQLSYEDDLKRTMFSSIDRVTAEIREIPTVAESSAKICFFKA